MSNFGMDKRKRSLWERIVALLEEELAERRDRKVVVEVRGSSGPCQKEIDELSAEELRSLDPGLRGRVADLLLDRYLAQRGRVDLLRGRRPYTKGIQDLTPEDLPALIAADQEKVQEYREEREREEFVRQMREDLDLLLVAEFTAMR